MNDYSDEWVCTDCYFAHHYGVTATVTGTDHLDPQVVSIDEAHQLAAEGWTVKWYAGDTDTPADVEPLNRLDGYDLFDNTCADHYYGCAQCGQNGPENGIQEFSWSQCGGCGSMLGGSRYRLACTPISATARD